MRRQTLWVRRKVEGNRLEEEVWALAYEQVWPLVRRAVSESRLDASAETSAAPLRQMPWAVAA